MNKTLLKSIVVLVSFAQAMPLPVSAGNPMRCTVPNALLGVQCLAPASAAGKKMLKKQLTRAEFLLKHRKLAERKLLRLPHSTALGALPDVGRRLFNEL